MVVVGYWLLARGGTWKRNDASVAEERIAFGTQFTKGWVHDFLRLQVRVSNISPVRNLFSSCLCMLLNSNYSHIPHPKNRKEASARSIHLMKVARSILGINDSLLEREREKSKKRRRVRTCRMQGGVVTSSNTLSFLAWSLRSHFKIGLPFRFHFSRWTSQYALILCLFRMKITFLFLIVIKCVCSLTFH